MQTKQWFFTELFAQFIKDSYSGKRMKNDGKRLRPQSIENYAYVLSLIKEFEQCNEIRIYIKIISLSNKKLMLAEQKYWNKFYIKFTDFLYRQKGFFDNYVGNVIKTIRAFFRYLQNDKMLLIGNFYKQFYVRKEEIPIITLLPDQLHFLINNKAFETSLPEALQNTKHIFVFGCTVALRFSDLFKIRFSDINQFGGSYYLAIKSTKTDVTTRIKLPLYALDILENFKRKKRKRREIFPSISEGQFNKNIRSICEFAGWTQEMGKQRSKRGKLHTIKNVKTNEHYRFCDLVSSHTMRRTAITTMLMLGMPEHMVKKISGHSANSKAFYRYVHLAQSYIDMHVDKVYEKLTI